MSEPDFRDALVLTGGGTGGHFFPAVALAEGAIARWPSRPVVFIGAARGIEAGKLPGSPWPHLLLDVEGFVGRSPLALLRAGRKLWTAFRGTRARFKKERPWAVVGTGGYAAAPALLAARSLGIPYFLHESNAVPGSLVKHLAPSARRVWCGMEALSAWLPGSDCLLVGTPVRATFIRPFRPLKVLREPFRLLVLGGSGGARAINEAALGLAPGLLESFPDWEIRHQTGALDFQRLSSAARHPRHSVEPFIEGMDDAFEGASLVLCRAGAVTCAELRASGRGAVLVPLPGSAGDHQTLNAQAMSDEGRAVVVPQGPDFESRLEFRLAPLMASAEAREGLGRAEHNQAVGKCLDDLARFMAEPASS